ncbi:MAG: beta-ketoacyl synthase N-terminal-like domain-containing protein [Segniliparus sp.]|uniref:beta-ketoacyl synthase N-terminal-like domain-containing protein n=1 Tax=Segniliparus sp. TaxID=2804064 RepID=UPI003F3B24E9
MRTEHSTQPVVVTGTGVVLPTGRGVGALWDAWTVGKPAVSEYRNPLVASQRITHFGHLPPELVQESRDSVPHKQRKYATEFTFNAVLAAQDAIAEAGASWADIGEDRRGLYVAQDDSTALSLKSLAKGLDRTERNGGLDVTALSKELLVGGSFDPFTIIHRLNNNTLALVSIIHRFQGDCAAMVQGESGAVAALEHAVFALRNGYCDTAVVVGAGSYNEPLRLAGHYRLGNLTKGTRGAESLRSFDLERDGTVLGEGAVALVLERADDAARRGAKPLVELGGTAVFPNRSDLAHSAVVERYRDLLGRGGLRPEQLDVVLADGKGTVAHDAAEAELLASLLGGADVPVSTVRPITGTPGAAGPLADLALAGQIFAQEAVPPIANLSRPLSDKLDFVADRPRQLRADSVFGLYSNFNGFASATLAKRPSATIGKA